MRVIEYSTGTVRNGNTDYYSSWYGPLDPRNLFACPIELDDIDLFDVDSDITREIGIDCSFSSVFNIKLDDGKELSCFIDSRDPSMNSSTSDCLVCEAYTHPSCEVYLDDEKIYTNGVKNNIYTVSDDCIEQSIHLEEVFKKNNYQVYNTNFGICFVEGKDDYGKSTFAILRSEKNHKLVMDVLVGKKDDFKDLTDYHSIWPKPVYKRSSGNSNCFLRRIGYGRYWAEIDDSILPDEREQVSNSIRRVLSLINVPRSKESFDIYRKAAEKSVQIKLDQEAKDKSKPKYISGAALDRSNPDESRVIYGPKYDELVSSDCVLLTEQEVYNTFGIGVTLGEMARMDNVLDTLGSSGNSSGKTSSKKV